MKYILITILFGLLLTGCGVSSYHLKVVNAQTNEIFLTSSKEDPVKVGDVFILYGMGQSHGGRGGHDKHGGGGTSSMKELIGYVKVTEVLDGTHAKVELLSGRVIEHAIVERVR